MPTTKKQNAVNFLKGFLLELDSRMVDDLARANEKSITCDPGFDQKMYRSLPNSKEQAEMIRILQAEEDEEEEIRKKYQDDKTKIEMAIKVLERFKE